MNPIFGYALEVDFENGFEAVATLDVQSNNTEYIVRDPRIDNQFSFYVFRIQAVDNCSNRSAKSEIVSSLSINQFFTDVTENFNTYISWENCQCKF